jgi:hypothetical protein
VSGRDIVLDSSKILRNSYEKLWKKSEGSVLGRLMFMQCIKLLVSVLHDIGIWNEQGKTMDPQLSTETLKNLTKDIYLCFSLYHKISVDDLCMFNI